MLKIHFSKSLQNARVSILLLAILLLGLHASPGLLAAEVSAQSKMINNLIIDDIVCQGNDNTSCLFITNKYYQRIGDQLNPDKIDEAKLRLSTLNQFRDISVHLEKGHQKGYIIVVFKVIESEHLQYELTSYYSQRQYGSGNGLLFFRAEDENNSNIILKLKTKGIQDERTNFESRVIDYNFLGSGKQLSLSVSNHTIEFSSVGQYFSSFSDSGISNSYLDTTKTNLTTIYLDYFDPHLFDSEKYFFLGQLGIFNTENKTYFSNINEFGIATQQVSKLNNLFSFSVATIGMRFAEYSTFSMTTNKSELDDKIEFGWAYGWNSQNDNLFPTQGSFFRLQYRKNYDRNESDLYLDFQKNHKLSDRIAFSYGIGESVLSSKNQQQGSSRILYGTNESDTKLFVKFSGLLSSNKVSGDYSGWNLGYQFTDYSGGGLFANYVYHTDKIIFNFGLTYYSERGFE